MPAILDVLLALLYPPDCAGCRRDLAGAGPPRFCGACRRRMGRIAEPCERCAEPAAAPTCARCSRRSPPFGRVLASFSYREESPLATALTAWKYGGDLVAGRACERLFAEETAPRAPCYDLVVPVPLHGAKLRHRGFNQAALLARALCRARPPVGLFAPTVLSRRGAGAVQAALGRRERSHNVRTVFLARPAVAGKRILVVDDVLTSGATATSCARALLRAGATAVDVAVLARTPRPRSGPGPATAVVAPHPGGR